MRCMAITNRKLEQAEAAFRKAAERAEEHRQRRNALVREAIAEGWTHQEIADATGLARSRVSQLVPPRTHAP
jgi:DNA-binding NarL/FixJ family response regulator